VSPPHLRYHLCVHSFFLPLFLSFLSSIDRHGVNLQNATNKQVPSHVESWCIASGDLNRFIFGDAGCSIWWGWFAFLGGREMENPFNVFLPRTSASTCQLELPAYGSRESLLSKLRVALDTKHDAFSFI
jgi:hypothetical protein